MKWSRSLAIPIVVAASILLGACGSSSSSSSSSTTAAASTTAQKQAVTPPPTTPPTQIQVSQPLSKTPPKGKTVLFLQCQLPACERYLQGFQQATKALGWTLQVQVFSAAAPGAALAQAVLRHPNYIAISGIPAAAVQPQLAAAAKAGIPVISCATPERPSAGGWAAQCGGQLVVDAQYISHWMINDSGGKANMVAVTIPQYPILNTETDWLKSNLKSLCAGCSYDQLNVSVDDLTTGAVPQKVAGYVQAHPNVNYVYFTFNNLEQGVPPALRTIGATNKVKLVGAAGDASIMKVIGTTNSAWTIAPNVYSAWVMVDAMARLAVGDPITTAYENSIYNSPTWVVDSQQAAQILAPNNYDWFGPGNFQTEFMKLWHVA
jgi:ribose transport system substrate-binding protein